MKLPFILTKILLKVQKNFFVWLKIWHSIISPFAVINSHKHDFVLWFIYIVFAGLLGVIINVVKLCAFDGECFQKALSIDSQAGSFYTFSLVICASLIWPIFKSLTNKEKPEYHLIQTILLSILIFSNLFCAIFYAFSNIHPHTWFWKINDDYYPLDIPQLVFFTMSIILSIYSFGLTYLPEHQNKYKVTDDHLRNENEWVESLKDRIGNHDTGTDSLTDPETQQTIKL